MQVKLVTYSDISLEDSLLIETANKYHLNIEILPLEEKWRSHWHKIILLYDYLMKVENKETMICFIDAFDTLINLPFSPGNSTELLSSNTVLFGAEANFALTFDQLRQEVKEKYPIKHSHYNFLNAGTFMGRASDLIQLIDSLCLHFSIDLKSPDLLDHRYDDQCYFSRYYVQQENREIEPNIRIELDHKQQVFGCTGGRTAAIIWPINKLIVQGIYFRKERNYLRKNSLLDQQDLLIDYRFINNKFVNLITNSSPLILHCPGTGKSFKKIIRKGMNNQRSWELQKLKKNGLQLVKCRVNSLILATKLYLTYRKSSKNLINHYH